MVKVTGIDSESDTAMIKDFAMFCLRKFLSTRRIKKARIEIRLLFPEDLEDQSEAKEFRKFSAWVINDYAAQSFTIFINKSCINKSAKKAVTKYKNIMKYLAHEIVHIKQYLKGELTDYADGTVRYKGRLYPNADKIAAADPMRGAWHYWDAPYEIEAYGRMEGLYTMYLHHINDCATALPV